MIKKLIILIFCISFLSPVFAQTKQGADENRELSSSIASSKPTTKQVDELVKRCYEYIERPGEKKPDIDTAFGLASKAQQLSKALRYDKGYNDALLAQAYAHIEEGDTRGAHLLVPLAHDTTKARILLELEGRHYHGDQVTQSNDSAKICALKALSYLKPQKYPDIETEARTEIMLLSIVMGDDKMVEEQYAQALQLKGKASIELMILMYHSLSIIYYNKGNLSQAMRFGLEGLHYSEQTNRFMIERMYSILGTIYRNQKEPEKSLEMFEKATAINKANKQIDRVWIAVDWMANILSELKRPEEALRLVYNTEKEVGFSTAMDKAFYYRAIGRVNQERGNTEESNKAFFALAKHVDEKKITEHNTIDYLCKFFYRIKDYDKSRYYINKALSAKNVGDAKKLSVLKTLFSIDSAMGNHEAALKTMLQVQVLQDTVRSVERDKNLKQLLLQYETEKKDKELQLQKQSIQLLSRESELKAKDLEQTRIELLHEAETGRQNRLFASISAAEKDMSIQLQKQNITLLQKDADLKQSLISKASFTRDIMIGGAALLFVILLLLFNQYRLKQRNASALADKNKRLEVLVNEKELLLKEVHHRVKNNLHTIISLLESQAHFLSDDALTAIQKSQHRVYAMSLIHQKLYQHDNATSVQMDDYLNELLCYLEESFDLNGSIRFEKNLEPIQLDISQAIPLGLILNEAITNSIKYAFPQQRGGIVSITLTQTANDMVHLSVSDNGIGLPAGWEQKLNQSLGVKLMKGLSEDIQASFNIGSEGGTRVSVEFAKARFNA